MSDFSDWLARFVTFSASGTSVSAVVGLGAMIGVVVAFLKHFGGSDDRRPGHWLVLSYDIWTVAALSLGVTFTFLVGQTVHLANARLNQMADALVYQFQNEDLAAQLAALTIEHDAAMMRLDAYRCIDALIADPDALVDSCPIEAERVDIARINSGLDFNAEQLAQFSASLEDWLSASVAALIAR